MHCESKAGDETRHVMIDFGYTPEALLNNMDIIGVDPALFDAMVLSHGHYDHFGGMVGFLGYDAVRRLERLPDTATDDLGLAPSRCWDRIEANQPDPWNGSRAGAAVTIVAARKRQEASPVLVS